MEFKFVAFDQAVRVLEFPEGKSKMMAGSLLDDGRIPLGPRDLFDMLLSSGKDFSSELRERMAKMREKAYHWLSLVPHPKCFENDVSDFKLTGELFERRTKIEKQEHAPKLDTFRIKHFFE